MLYVVNASDLIEWRNNCYKHAYGSKKEQTKQVSPVMRKEKKTRIVNLKLFGGQCNICKVAEKAAF